MIQKIHFRINREEQTLDIEPEMMVVDIIRDKLNLTGTKRGCDNATCGSCVIIMNGRAIKSCNTPALKADTAEIITVEGLANGMNLHPVQTAFVKSGAIQCGFCTPGIEMELVALFDKKPDADEIEIANALNKHLCRCTGYEPIHDAVIIAQEIIKERKAENTQ